MFLVSLNNLFGPNYYISFTKASQPIPAIMGFSHRAIVFSGGGGEPSLTTEHTVIIAGGYSLWQ